MAIVLVESYSAGFRVQIYSQNREAGLTHHMGEKRKQMKETISNNLFV